MAINCTVCKNANRIFCQFLPQGDLIMYFYRNDLLIDKILESMLTKEQHFLAEFTGRKFSKTEAKIVWEKVVDHKWYVSERLQRDIGLRVAAVDFIENFYEPTHKSQKTTIFGKMFGTYFTSKGSRIAV
jgi:hypothetical protein